MRLPTRMYSDKAGETATTVKDDNISFSCGWPRSQQVAAAALDCVSAGHLALPDSTVSKRQASGPLTYSDGDSISVVVVSLGLACCTYLHFTRLHHPPGCGFHSPIPNGNLLALFSLNLHILQLMQAFTCRTSEPNNRHKQFSVYPDSLIGNRINIHIIANIVYSVICQVLQTHDYLLSHMAYRESSSTDGASLPIYFLYVCR